MALTVICFVISSCETAEEAMKFFGEMRTHNGKVVIIVFVGNIRTAIKLLLTCAVIYILYPTSTVRLLDPAYSTIICTSLVWVFRGTTQGLTHILPRQYHGENDLLMTSMPTQFKDMKCLDSLY